jgi:hypothetical protein
MLIININQINIKLQVNKVNQIKKENNLKKILKIYYKLKYKKEHNK